MAEVVPFTGVPDSVRKTDWMALAARKYDQFVRDVGAEPSALVFVCLGRGALRAAWDINEEYARPYPAAGALLIVAEYLRRQAFVDEQEDGKGYAPDDPAA